jgi:hypothetical protein
MLGYLGIYQPFEQLEASEWQHILEVNVIGVFRGDSPGSPDHAARERRQDCQSGTTHVI